MPEIVAQVCLILRGRAAAALALLHLAYVAWMPRRAATSNVGSLLFAIGRLDADRVSRTGHRVQRTAGQLTANS